MVTIELQSEEEQGKDGLRTLQKATTIGIADNALGI
jgi:hypothetical protein